MVSLLCYMEMYLNLLSFFYIIKGSVKSFAPWDGLWGKEILSHTDEVIRVIEDAIFDIEKARFEGGPEDDNYT